ncbi:MAG TPA: SUMF1/EgtB/PvdO family nonheme iron enzyme [Desulfuromonadales bacterium]|nr:SUMF1/EgtB/PvdO family nonheme iron enzyme [Desulfuromonadales bacterium]
MRIITKICMALAFTILGVFVYPEISHSQLVSGSLAPLFTLKGLDNKTFNLGVMKDKPLTILYFFDMGSQSSEKGLNSLNALARKHKMDISVWAITAAPREKVAQFAAMHGVAFAILPDDENVNALYQARQILPVVCIISTGLKIAYYEQGWRPTTETKLTELIEQVLKTQAKLDRGKSVPIIKPPPKPPVSVPPKPQVPVPVGSPTPLPAPEPVQSGLTDPTTGMAFMPVKGGCFEMRSPLGENMPGQEVCVKDFSMGKYEVTVGEYRKFTKATGGNYPQWEEVGSKYNVNTGSDNHYRKLKNALTDDRNPVVGISWFNAVAFADWLSRQSGGRVYRLPSEAEWEYSCRSGGKDFKYCGGDAVDAVAWNSANSGGTTHRVGQKSANGLGLYDMGGNVWEWMDIDGAGTSDQKQDLQGPAKSSTRVIRGGGWDSDPVNAFSYVREFVTPGIRSKDLGFRLILQDPD